MTIYYVKKQCKTCPYNAYLPTSNPFGGKKEYSYRNGRLVKDANTVYTVDCYYKDVCPEFKENKL